MRKVMTFVAAIASLLVGACNTVEGVGRDVQAAGRTVGGLFDGGDEQGDEPPAE